MDFQEWAERSIKAIGQSLSLHFWILITLMAWAFLLTMAVVYLLAGGR